MYHNMKTNVFFSMFESKIPLRNNVYTKKGLYKSFIFYQTNHNIQLFRGRHCISNGISIQYSVPSPV